MQVNPQGMWYGQDQQQGPAYGTPNYPDRSSTVSPGLSVPPSPVPTYEQIPAMYGMQPYPAVQEIGGTPVQSTGLPVKGQDGKPVFEAPEH